MTELPDDDFRSRHGRSVVAESDALWWAVERYQPEEPMR